MSDSHIFSIAPPQWRTHTPSFRLGLSMIVLIAFGLYIDAHFHTVGQVIADVLVWGAFGWLLWRAAYEMRLRLLLCVVIATVGEIWLSLGWGLYEYWARNVPWFVPPGHAVLMLLGMLIAAQGVAKWFCYLSWAVAMCYAVYAAYVGYANFELVLLALFTICMYYGRSKALYAVMFWLTICMELYGTWLGNWRWLAVEPVFGLTNTNPPILVGAAYCVLDAMVMVCTRKLQRRMLRQTAST